MADVLRAHSNVIPFPRQPVNINRGAPHGFAPQRFEYDKHGERSEIDPHLQADITMTKRIAVCLEQHYPSHPWMVKVSHAQGIAQISLPILMPKNTYFVLHLHKLYSDPCLRAVMRAGGDILERYDCSRTHFGLDRFLIARDASLMGRRRPVKLVFPGQPGFSMH